MYDVTRGVPREDLGQSRLDSHGLPARSRRQVGIGQGICRRGVFGGKLAGEDVSQSAGIGLGPGAGVVGDELTQPLVVTDRTEVPGAVERMEARPGDLRGIADVMQPRGRDEEPDVVVVHGAGHTDRRPRGAGYVSQSRAARSEQSDGLAPGERDHHCAPFTVDRRAFEPCLHVENRPPSLRRRLQIGVVGVVELARAALHGSERAIGAMAGSATVWIGA